MGKTAFEKSMYGVPVPTLRAPEPSQADESLTRRLKDALALIDVRVLDHIIVGGADTVSFAERGML